MSKRTARDRPPPTDLGRRQFVHGIAAVSAALALGGKTARGLAAGLPQTQLHGRDFDLEVAPAAVNFTGRPALATTVNGSVPAPTLRWRQGDEVTIRVNNRLAEATSIHWHGIVLPYQMDGVPGISFDGIPAHSSFAYRFRVQQAGTYWYHSHSGFQEQTGLYGALLIDPLTPEPFAYDRDYVVMLSDWTDEDPQRVLTRLKKDPEYYNMQRRTLKDLRADVRTVGWSEARRSRRMWNTMRMRDRDISDVTGYGYTYLLNGCPPAANWQAPFARGDKVRLRLINGSSMTFFDLRIPGLAMTVVAADGQNVEPVTVEELRIGVAETYDVIVTPDDDTAYSIFAQAIDRSGYACGTLTPNPALSAEVPPLDPAPALEHIDMAMGSATAGHSAAEHSGANAPAHPAAADHGAIGHAAASAAPAAVHDGAHSAAAAQVTHSAAERGPEVDMRAAEPQSRLDDPGVGLRNRSWRVLTYGDLKHLGPSPDHREPSRELELHLTGNMHRYLWSFDGIRASSADPIEVRHNERLRITLVNDTMMHHPIHLHGMWSDLETGDEHRLPRKHTVTVQPGQKISYRVTADALGPWAYHCHMLYHMEAGMFRVMHVR